MPTDESAAPSGLGLRALAPLLASRRGIVAAVVALSAGAAAVDLFVPLLIRRFIDDASADAATSVLVGLAVVFLVASVVGQLLGLGSAWIGARLGWAVTNDLRVLGTRHATLLDLDFHAETPPGTLIERLDGDMTAVAETVSRFGVRMAHVALLVVGAVLVLAFQDGWAALALAVWVVVVVALVVRFRSSGVEASAEERGASAELFGFIEEHLEAVDDLRANGAGPAVMERFRSVARHYATAGTRSWRRRAIAWSITVFLFSTGLLVSLALGVAMVSAGTITLGTAFLFVQYFQRVEDPIQQATRQMSEVQKAAAGLGRLSHLLSLRPRVARTGHAALPPGALSVELDGVEYAYEEAPVLRGLALTIPAGQHVGLLGRTGSGKSTLMSLLVRFDDPTRGTVRLGGMPLDEVDREHVRARVAMIPQGVHVMDGTVKDNVTFFDHDVPDAEVCAALAEIGLGEILSLPRGIHTPVGEAGLGLSEGEAQLLGLARAWLRDPALVLLDEPSSRLDPVTEARLAAATDRLLAGRTAVVIAHRLDTVDRVDRIVVLSDGEVVEDGPRTALAADPHSHFARLRQAAGTGS